MARACLVSGREDGLDAAGADRLRDAGLSTFRTVGRAAFRFDLGLVMESSEVCATPSAAPPQPRLAKSQPAGQDPEAGCSRPSHHSNAPFGLECQSILSKIVAAWVSQNGRGSTIRWFDPSRPSQPVAAPEKLPPGWEERPKIGGLLRFGDRLPNSPNRRPICRKSPASTANIPVFGRLTPETGFGHHCVAVARVNLGSFSAPKLKRL